MCKGVDESKSVHELLELRITNKNDREMWNAATARNLTNEGTMVNEAKQV